MIPNGVSAGECSSEPLTGVGDLPGWGACYLFLDPYGLILSDRRWSAQVTSIERWSIDVRQDLGLAEEIAAVHPAAERHRDLVRRRFGVVLDPAGARKVAAEAIREAAYARNHPPDLINIALERLAVEAAPAPPIPPPA